MQVNIQGNYAVKKNQKPKITLGNRHLQKIQSNFALATITIPFCGSIAALVLLQFIQISILEIGLLLSFYFLSILGITVGFHRLFSHCSFQTTNVIKVILAILGCMAAEGPVIHWVSNHRRHHQYSDQIGDPHSPYFEKENKLTGFHKFWHSHIGWMVTGEVTNSILFAKDLIQDPIIAKVNQLYFLWVALGLIIPAILGVIIMQSWIGFLQGLLWGGFVRIFLGHHITWSINSITHLYGTCPFKTNEHSTNNIWLTIPSCGEAWHNNHHAFPNSAIFGLRWWQIDIGGWIIRLLEFTGLVWNVKTPSKEAIKAKSISNN